MTNKINSLDNDHQNNDEETKATEGEAGGELSDYLVSTGSGDDSHQGRRYKVVTSALDF